MARAFTKNTANTMSLGSNSLGALLNGASKVTLACFARPSVVDGSSGSDRFVHINIATNTTGLTLCAGGSSVVQGAGRSVNTDGFQVKAGTTPLPTDGSWCHLGAVFDIGGKTIQPYFNGAPEGGGAVTFNNATWTNGTHTTDVDAIGFNGQAGAPPAATQPMVAGNIAEVGVWKTGLTNAEMSVLATGVSPQYVQNSNLVAYFHIFGVDSPEQDPINGKTGTISGSILPAQHPPQYFKTINLTGVGN